MRHPSSSGGALPPAPGGERSSSHLWLAALARWRKLTLLQPLAHDMLDLALDVAREALSRGSSAAQRAEVLRATLHLRPSNAYRAVIARQVVDLEEQELLSSASLWQWLIEHRAPMSLDTSLGLLGLLDGSGRVIELDDPTQAPDKPLGSRSSLLLLLERDATHILLIPLMNLGGELVGMLCIEAGCESAIGLPSLWKEGVAPLLHLAALATPFLLDRSDQEESSQEGEEGALVASALEDELLPVVGARTRSIVTILSAFAQQEETLLLSGETGVGKSRMAAWCHARSARRQGAFEVLDLLSVPEAMQIAHLVGWKKGAFTGAERNVDGAIARASGGTLFIDEIDKLTLSTQASLLRLLETRHYQPLGDSSGDMRADVRFIIGTNLDLLEQVEQGRFRADLYYRICVLPIHLPALRDRDAQELLRWAEFMLARMASGGAPAPKPKLSREARALLEAQRWPGNLRQLDNVMRRAFALWSMGGGSGEVDGDHVRQALAMEGPLPTAALLAAAPREAPRRANDDLYGLMREAASRYVELARARREQGMAPIELALLDALRGLALEEAMERGESLEQTFELVGKGALLKNRNHHKALKRERALVQALREALDA